MLKSCFLLVSVMATLFFAGQGHAQTPGIVGAAAPRWDVGTWYNLPEGVEALDVDDYRGKVLYLYGFQSWCPGCHSRGFPSLLEVMKHYKERDDIQFVAIQTVFEGFGTNTAEKAKETADAFGLSIPIGHDPGSSGKRSNILERYRTGGTPWTMLIDRAGVVRANDFFMSPKESIEILDGLLAEKDESLPSGSE